MIILGIDPGTTTIGYALLKGGADGKLIILTADLIKITTQNQTQRLGELYHGLTEIIELWKPSVVSIERIFFAKNAKTALAVSEARGAIILTTTLAGLTVYEYTPLEIKSVITGDGRADKKQVKKMVALTLPETAKFKARDDVFDAIAIALTCYFKERLNPRVYK